MPDVIPRKLPKGYAAGLPPALTARPSFKSKESWAWLLKTSGDAPEAPSTDMRRLAAEKFFVMYSALQGDGGGISASNRNLERDRAKGWFFSDRSDLAAWCNELGISVEEARARATEILNGSTISEEGKRGRKPGKKRGLKHG